MKYICLLAAIALFDSRLPAQDAIPKSLGSMQLDLDTLRKWETRIYTYRAKSPGQNVQKHFGTFTLSTDVKSGQIVLVDQLELTYRGEKLSLNLKHECKQDSYLSPVLIESEGSGSDELGTFTLTVDGTDATVRRKGQMQVIELPKGTVTSWAFMRLVTLLPRQKGSVVVFDHWMESEELNQKRKFQVESLGVDSIHLGDVDVSCTKFRLDGGGNHPAYYWVDESDVLQQVLADGRKLIQLMER